MHRHTVVFRDVETTTPYVEAKVAATERMAEWIAAMPSDEREDAFALIQREFAAAEPGLKVPSFMLALRDYVDQIDQEASPPSPRLA